MDSVEFNGVTYVKASVAAKSFRYTSDYIGQLCRAKKVDARLVGRTWFVNPDSLKEHKQNKFKTSAEEASHPVSNTPSEIKVARTAVHPVVNTRAVRVIKDTTSNNSRTRALKVSYDRDEESLLPKLTKKHVRPPKTIRIELVNAKKVKISDSKKNTTAFHADELPDIALSGNLKITTYPEQEHTEDISDSDNNIKNKAISPEQDFKKGNDIKNIAINEAAKKVQKRVSVVSTGNVKTGLGQTTSGQNLSEQKVEIALPSPFTPSILQTSPTKSVSTFTLMSPLIATFVAVVCVAFILSASVRVEVFQSVYESHIVFQMANLLEVLRR